MSLFYSSCGNYSRAGYLSPSLRNIHERKTASWTKQIFFAFDFPLLSIFTVPSLLRCTSPHSFSAGVILLFPQLHSFSYICMCQGNILREVYDNSYRILDSLWWVFVKYFSVYWNCLILCYFASKLSTSEDAPAISELPAFLSQMFHSKIFSQLDGKSVKLQKAVVGIISLNDTLIFWFHMGEWHKNLKYESPILLLIYLNKFQFQHSKCKLTNMDYTECKNMEHIQKLLQPILLPIIHLFYFSMINECSVYVCYDIYECQTIVVPTARSLLNGVASGLKSWQRGLKWF